MSKIFILSPARTTGKKGAQLHNPKSKSQLALRLQRGESVAIGEVFSFLSALYFRGKMAYVRCFSGENQAFVITSNQGLVSVDMPISLADLQSFSEEEIDFHNESYRRPLEIDLAAWSKEKDHQFILLGSIASPKYVKVLQPFLQGRLYVPKGFSDLGDMSRGAMMLRHAAENVEMEYEPFPK